LSGARTFFSHEGLSVTPDWVVYPGISSSAG
jgi:hypothetical protein